VGSDRNLHERKQNLIIVAGADYGQGSSRDWAAKGVRLAGVEVIVAEGFERIHRTNLVGMGVLPVEFKPGTTRLTLGSTAPRPTTSRASRHRARDLTLVIHRKTGEVTKVPVTCRLDTAAEVHVYNAGGVLQRFAQDFLESASAGSLVVLPSTRAGLRPGLMCNCSDGLLQGFIIFYPRVFP
jgi:2-methylcitrate dehydratase (2-methyl-trans-aconitate forming)